MRDYRLTIQTIGIDPRAEALRRSAQHLGLPCPDDVGVADVMHLRGNLDDAALERLHRVLVDPLLQGGTWELPTCNAIEIVPLPGVTDPAGTAMRHVATSLGIEIEAAVSGRRIEFPSNADQQTIEVLATRLIANTVVERWTHGPAEPPLDAPDVASTPAATVVLSGRSDDELLAISIERGLALDLDEMTTIVEHFAELGREPTDVELETLAQTWSEHCAHKTFRATLDVTSSAGISTRPSLLGLLRQCTDDINAPYVRSAFVGNAGVVEFVDGTTIALKAETHNHPSAIEPFGGANTGVGGVIRDVIGMAHRPTAVTDILCFGPTDLPMSELPDGTLHPRRIADGVVDGIADYGNKIGLPTVAGAVVHHPAYTANPLVFAGCIGVATNWHPHSGPHPGDRVIVLGGRTGRDGIRGATFSSLTMDASTGSVAGASVQIGDPITEKLLIDVLDGAEHLYTAITDCGAGGLSSAVGEMAEHVGADVELDAVPLKYAGLEPWEVWLSEAQERMVISVHPSSISELTERCRRHGVEMSDIGVFTGDGRLVVRSGDVPVVDLDATFLHDGRPPRVMSASMPEPVRTDTSRAVSDVRTALLSLLAHPNLRTRAPIIRRYDHEIGGATLGRPLVGVERDAPGDAALLASPTATSGVAIGIGVNPFHGLHDPEHMGWSVVDEAIRNVVAVGADPDRIALLDNFSFGDPRRASTMGDLVAAVDGCTAAARAFSAPFVSGKDSLNNEYTGPDGHRHAVPPTLVITAVGHVPQLAHRPTPTLTAPGKVIMLTGSTGSHFAGSHLDEVLGVVPADVGSVPEPDASAPDRYRALHRAMIAGYIHACHDLAEGGLGVALAEMCIAGRLGIRVDNVGHSDLIIGLFSESCGRILVEVDADEVARLIADIPNSTVIGTVTDDGALTFPDGTSLAVDELVAAHHSTEVTAP